MRYIQPFIVCFLSSIVICTGAWLIVVCLLNSQLSSNPKEMEMEIEIRHKNLFHVNLIMFTWVLFLRLSDPT